MPPCLPSAISGARHQHIVSTNNSTTSSSSSSFSFSTITRTYVFLARDIEDQPSSRSKPPAEKIDMTSVRRSAVRHLQIAWTPRCHGPALLTSRASSQNTRQPWSIHLLSRPHHFFSLPIIVLRRLCHCSFVAHLYTSRQRYSVDFLESLVGIVQNLHPPPRSLKLFLEVRYTRPFLSRGPPDRGQLRSCSCLARSRPRSSFSSEPSRSVGGHNHLAAVNHPHSHALVTLLFTIHA